MNYFGILTPLGKQKIAECTANKTQINITHIGIGSGDGGNEYEPQENQTSLKGYWLTIPVRDIKIKENHIIVEGIIDETQGGDYIRELSLIDSSGVVLAIANHPPVEKLIGQSSSIIRLAINTGNNAVFNLHIDTSEALVTRDEFYQHTDNADLHNYEIYPLPNTIAKRYTNGRLQVGQPVDNFDAVRLQDLNSAINTAVANGNYTNNSFIPTLVGDDNLLTSQTRLYKISNENIGFSPVNVNTFTSPTGLKIGTIFYFTGSGSLKVKMNRGQPSNPNLTGLKRITLQSDHILALMLIDFEQNGLQATPIFKMLSGGTITDITTGGGTTG